MSLLGMPILILNLGGEMLYILDQVDSHLPRCNLPTSTPFAAASERCPEHPQRLRAQKIEPEKATKGATPQRKLRARPSARPSRLTLHPNVPAVLQDVVVAMFSREFITELFKPQQLYTNHSARQIFDKLAHSSIMRLSTSSMDKVRCPLWRVARRLLRFVAF